MQAAALAGLLLLAGLIAPAGSVVETVLFWAAAVVGGATFVPGALRGLMKGRLGVGLLMTIAAVGAVLLGEIAEAAMLAFLFAIAEGLEGYALTRTRNSLRALLDLVPPTATVLRNGTPTTVGLAELRVGDTLLVRPGDKVATDGVVISGRTAIDTSVVTGESVPVEVGPGSEVFAGTVNGTGAVEVQGHRDRGRQLAGPAGACGAGGSGTQGFKPAARRASRAAAGSWRVDLGHRGRRGR